MHICARKKRAARSGIRAAAVNATVDSTIAEITSKLHLRLDVVRDSRGKSARETKAAAATVNVRLRAKLHRAYDCTRAN